MRRFFASVLAAILGLGLALPPEAHAANLVPVKNIPIPGFPLNLADPRGTGLSTDFIRFDPTTNLIYLTDGANKSVDVFDAATKQMVDRITMADVPHDVIVDDALHVMITPLSNKTVVITNLTNGMQSTITVGGTSIADLSGYDPATK